MEALTIEDLYDEAPTLHEWTWLGKRCWIKELHFDVQMQISERQDLSEGDKLKLISGMSLANEDGSPFFHDAAQALSVLGDLHADKVMDLYDKVESINGLNQQETSEK